MIDALAFDADDTLWHNETVFRDTHAEFRQLLSRYHDDAWIDRRLYETEVRNLAHFGYGVKSFMLSMVETAVELTEGRISGPEIQRIIELGKAMLNAPITLLAGVAETVEALARDRELMLITKGDLVDQESKLERSGLRNFFAHVEIVSRKEPATYRRILQRHRIEPRAFAMVGDSLRSDVMPVVAIGARAVHIPCETPWQHEVVDEPELPARGWVRLERIAEVPPWLYSLAQGEREQADRDVAPDP